MEVLIELNTQRKDEFVSLCSSGVVFITKLHTVRCLLWNGGQ